MFQSIFQKVHKNYPSVGWSRIFFGASCNDWLSASSADATKALQYVFVLLRGNHDFGGWPVSSFGMSWPHNYEAGVRSPSPLVPLSKEPSTQLVG